MFWTRDKLGENQTSQLHYPIKHLIERKNEEKCNKCIKRY